MMNLEFERVKTVFQTAVAEYRPDEWDSYLDRVCADDAQLRREVDDLLRAHRQSDSLLEHPVLAEGLPMATSLFERPGTVIGPYTLIEQIGEGGFGIVFLAEQMAPIRRRVALKVIKPGMDTREVIVRFEAERQALALMEHPNIAKVFDAGTTATGRPYFVMELVQGVPITEYADECQLTTRERLELFITACQAVQHAHQKGIIHRDLKPNNILVAMQDGRPAPTIIDFGVAKALDQRLIEHTLATGFAQMIGTPLYMSPEQAELSPLGADTRSDIYSLGVLLYELLTGATPYDKDRLHSASFDELRRIIREEEPPRPSTRFSTLAADQASTVAERRRTNPRHLRQLVRGELDWIVMKCLEKDRGRRYDSPNSLAADVERYLHHEPIHAGPPLLRYRFSKFVRRNRTFIATTGAIIAALVLGLMLTTRMYFRAATESSRAKAVSNFLQEMLSSADAGQANGRDYTVRQLLDEFSSGLGNQLAAEPEVEADVHATIGRSYLSLRLPYEARPHFEKSIEIRRNIGGADQGRLADTLVDYGLTLNVLARFTEAEPPIREAIEIYRRQGTTGDPLFHALEGLQLVLVNARLDVEAEQVTREAMAIAVQHDVNLFDKANLLQRYGSMKVQQGQLADGESLVRKSVDIFRQSHRENSPDMAHALRELGIALQLQGRLEEAEAALRESLAVFRRHYDEDHFYVRVVVNTLNAILETQGDEAGIRRLASDVGKRTRSSDSADSHVRLAVLLLSKQSATNRHLYEAQQLIRRALEECRRASVESPDNLERRLVAVRGFTDIAVLCADRPELSEELGEASHALDAEYLNLLSRFADPVDTIDILYTFGLVRSRQRDAAGYREICVRLLNVPDSGNDYREFRRAWTWCLGPDSLDSPESALDRVDIVFQMRKHNADHRLALGGFLYRCGEFERALQHLEIAASARLNDWYAEGMRVGAQLLTAMTKWQLGEKDEARQLLDGVRPAVEESLESPATRWNYRSTVEILYREASELIVPDNGPSSSGNHDESSP